MHTSLLPCKITGVDGGADSQGPSIQKCFECFLQRECDKIERSLNLELEDQDLPSSSHKRINIGESPFLSLGVLICKMQMES